MLSEDVAFEASAGIINRVLEKKGVAARYTSEELISEFVGLTFRRMMPVLQAKFDFQLEQNELESHLRLEEDRVIAKLREKAQPCAGSAVILEKLHQSRKYKMVVVSSSQLHRLRAALSATGQDRFFHQDDVYSAVNSLPTPKTKPDPAIYHHVLDLFGARPHECLAVEDSRSGAQSALAAGIPTLAYVGSYHSHGQKLEMVSKFQELGCKDVMWDWANFEKHLAGIEAIL